MKKDDEGIDEKIDNLAIMVTKGFDGVHKEFENIYKKFDNVYSEFDNVHKEFDSVHKEIKELKEEVNKGFEDHIKAVRVDYDNLTNRVKQLETTQK